MTEDVKKIMSKFVSYVEASQSQLDKQAEAMDKYSSTRSNFIKKAHQIAGVLANKGLISRNDVDAFVDKVASDETGNVVWNLVERLANSISTDTLGTPAEEKMASGRKLDAFEKLVLFGDARSDSMVSGMVD